MENKKTAHNVFDTFVADAEAVVKSWQDGKLATFKRSTEQLQSTLNSAVDIAKTQLWHTLHKD